MELLSVFCMLLLYLDFGYTQNVDKTVEKGHPIRSHGPKGVVSLKEFLDAFIPAVGYKRRIYEYQHSISTTHQPETTTHLTTTKIPAHTNFILELTDFVETFPSMRKKVIYLLRVFCHDITIENQQIDLLMAKLRGFIDEKHLGDGLKGVYGKFYSAVKSYEKSGKTFSLFHNEELNCPIFIYWLTDRLQNSGHSKPSLLGLGHVHIFDEDHLTTTTTTTQRTTTTLRTTKATFKPTTTAVVEFDDSVDYSEYEEEEVIDGDDISKKRVNLNDTKEDLVPEAQQIHEYIIKSSTTQKSIPNRKKIHKDATKKIIAEKIKKGIIPEAEGTTTQKSIVNNNKRHTNVTENGIAESITEDLTTKIQKDIENSEKIQIEESDKDDIVPDVENFIIKIPVTQKTIVNIHKDTTDKSTAESFKDDLGPEVPVMQKPIVQSEMIHKEVTEKSIEKSVTVYLVPNVQDLKIKSSPTQKSIVDSEKNLENITMKNIEESAEEAETITIASNIIKQIVSNDDATEKSITKTDIKGIEIEKSIINQNDPLVTSNMISNIEHYSSKNMDVEGEVEDIETSTVSIDDMINFESQKLLQKNIIEEQSNTVNVISEIKDLPPKIINSRHTATETPIEKSALNVLNDEEDEEEVIERNATAFVHYESITLPTVLVKNKSNSVGNDMELQTKDNIDEERSSSVTSETVAIETTTKFMEENIVPETKRAEINYSEITTPSEASINIELERSLSDIEHSPTTITAYNVEGTENTESTTTEYENEAQETFNKNTNGDSNRSIEVTTEMFEKSETTIIPEKSDNSIDLERSLLNSEDTHSTIVTSETIMTDVESTTFINKETTSSLKNNIEGSFNVVNDPAQFQNKETSTISVKNVESIEESRNDDINGNESNNTDIESTDTTTQKDVNSIEQEASNERSLLNVEVLPTNTVEITTYIIPETSTVMFKSDIGSTYTIMPDQSDVSVSRSVDVTTDAIEKSFTIKDESSSNQDIINEKSLLHFEESSTMIVESTTVMPKNIEPVIIVGMNDQNDIFESRGVITTAFPEISTFTPKNATESSEKFNNNELNDEGRLLDVSTERLQEKILETTDSNVEIENNSQMTYDKAGFTTTDKIILDKDTKIYEITTEI